MSDIESSDIVVALFFSQVNPFICKRSFTGFGILAAIFVCVDNKRRKISTQVDEGHPSLGLEEASILGSNVHRLRNRENLSQEKLGMIAGLTRQTVIRIEKGHPNARLSDIRKLADALGTTVVDLLSPHYR